VLISAEPCKLVFLQVVASRRIITTKHEGEFTAYAVQSWR
jgi:hypothetical protein